MSTDVFTGTGAADQEWRLDPQTRGGCVMPRLLVMHPELPECWALMPALIDRIQAMGQTLGGAGYAESVATRLKVSFAVPDPRIRAWVAVEDYWNGPLCGHAVATIEKDALGDYLLVWQAKTDYPMLRVTRAAWDNLLEWAGEQKATRVIAAARG